MIHKNFSKTLEARKTITQVKVKKNSHIKISKKYIKNQIKFIQMKRLHKIFLVKNLITILSHYKTIILKRILHKDKNSQQEINKNYKKFQE